MITGSFALFNTPTSAATTKSLPASGKVEFMLGASGKMPTTIYVPEGTGAKPLILVVHTSGGLFQSEHDYAMNLQKKGFIAVIPKGIQLEPDSFYPMVSYARGFYFFQEADNSVIKRDIFMLAVIA